MLDMSGYKMDQDNADDAREAENGLDQPASIDAPLDASLSFLHCCSSPSSY